MSAIQIVQPSVTGDTTQVTQIKSLLAACDLPTSDIALSSSMQFFTHHADDKLVGVIALEIHGTVALLRSLAVAPAQRNHGLGRSLVKFAEEYAAKHGIDSLYLLTTTAGEFFSRLGYASTAREDAPPSIKATPQFSGLCPASSVFMSKRLH
jgi:amino-acid N-acetyltransferase